MKPFRQSPANSRISRAFVLAASFAFGLSLSAIVGWAQPAGHLDRVEGVVEEVLGPDAVRIQTNDGFVTVDLVGLGGVNASVALGQKIVAVGTMESGGD